MRSVNSKDVLSLRLITRVMMYGGSRFVAPYILNSEAAVRPVLKDDRLREPVSWL